MTYSSTWKRTVQLTLSRSGQMTLYTVLCVLTLWTLFFSNAPAVHSAAHSLRHHTLGIACH
ncbi:CbtB-domain containing protein [Phormidium tenue FACHB-886]|nr:CbtB-domain containing protein [Phormidium tenue FACHB-886]